MSKKNSPRKKTSSTQPDKMRLWLTYPTKLITNPVIWELSRKFPIVTNIRQASVSDEIGIISLELSGPRAEIKSAIKWLEKIGVKVEPVEINVIEN
jgi:ABC-type methionine transport system ATPase subunit